MLLHHLPMAGIMLWAMLGGHSVLRSLVAGVALAVLAAAYGPAARTSRRARDQVVDLWAMALAFILPVTISASGALPGDHLHPMGSAMVTATPLLSLAAVAAAWAAARCLLFRNRVRSGTAGSARVSILSAGVTALGLAAMAVFCP